MRHKLSGMCVFVDIKVQIVVFVDVKVQIVDIKVQIVDIKVQISCIYPITEYSQ